MRVNLELQPGAVTATGVVAGTVPIPQIDRADSGAKIEVKQVQRL